MKNHKRVGLLLLAMLVVVGVTTAFANQLPMASDLPWIEQCHVSLIDDIQVSAQEAGLVVDIRTQSGEVRTVVEGQPVQRGMVLAQIDDRQAWLEKAAAESEYKAADAGAKDDINIRYSQAAHEVAQAEYQAALSVNARHEGTVPRSEIRRLQLTENRSRLEIERSRKDHLVAGLSAEVSKAKVNSANAAILRRRVTSPIDGIILTLFKKPGEWVQAGEPVARVVRMKKLRVQGYVSAKSYNPNELEGRPVTVYVDLARGQKASLPGVVTFVSPLVQAGNRYLVRAEVENSDEGGAWLLRPGMTAQVQIQTK